MSNKSKPIVYILINPSMPDYVKIGYTEDAEKYFDELNSSESIALLFDLYAYYEAPQPITNGELYKLIEEMKPELGRFKRSLTPGFYKIDPEEACGLLQAVASIYSSKDDVHKCLPDEEEKTSELIEELIHTISIK